MPQKSDIEMTFLKHKCKNRIDQIWSNMYQMALRSYEDIAAPGKPGREDSMHKRAPDNDKAGIRR